ncbi:MAG: hypothetical protein L6Q37_12240 [Bdellovibrionaceae bacterium]|nr:hypothetical protein [Pseudobdellovibrionaceae bacterium]NUM60370.1 hypothetical protein [Pseudobdellovibrionaceae bacterium]
MSNILIAEQKKKILEKFKERFSSLDFCEHFAESLIPKNDTSILFTNSTIVALKKYINGVEPLIQGKYIIQPCIRFQNFDYEDKNSTFISYMSYFNQLGVLAPPQDFSKLMTSIEKLFFQDFNLSKNRFIIKSTRRFNEKSQLYKISPQNFNVSFYEDTSFKYFQWNYGLSNVVGEGVTFAIQTTGNTYLDCGNIVEIKYQDQIVGYEFGFGLETLASRLLRYQTPVFCSQVSASLPQYVDQNYDLFKDMLQLSVEMVKLGIKPGKNKRKALLRKSLIIMAKEAVRLKISDHDVNDAIESYVFFIDYEKSVVTDLQKAFAARKNSL